MPNKQGSPNTPEALVEGLAKFLKNPELLPYTGNAVIQYLLNSNQMLGSLDVAGQKTVRAEAARAQARINGVDALTAEQEARADVILHNAISAQNLTNPLSTDATAASKVQHRNPFVLTCQQWLSATPARYIYCAVNPSDIQWKIALRAKDQKTRGGTVQHLWKSVGDARRDTFYDEPVLTINFQAGNILPVTDRLAGGVITRQQVNGRTITTSEAPSQRSDPIVPDGMKNFYDFMELMDTPRQFSDNGVQRDNPVYILYNSRIFPSMALTGMWTQDGFSFSDNAENPNEISNWTASFIVHDSYPKIKDNKSLINTYIRAGFGKI